MQRCPVKLEADIFRQETNQEGSSKTSWKILFQRTPLKIIRERQRRNNLKRFQMRMSRFTVIRRLIRTGEIKEVNKWISDELSDIQKE